VRHSQLCLIAGFVIGSVGISGCNHSRTSGRPACPPVSFASEMGPKTQTARPEQAPIQQPVNAGQETPARPAALPDQVQKPAADPDGQNPPTTQPPIKPAGARGLPSPRNQPAKPIRLPAAVSAKAPASVEVRQGLMMEVPPDTVIVLAPLEPVTVMSKPTAPGSPIPLPPPLPPSALASVTGEEAEAPVVQSNSIPPPADAATAAKTTLPGGPPAFGHSADYTILSGEVVQFRKTWRLRYATVDQADQHGGCVVLEGDEHLARLREGQFVRVQGKLILPESRAGMPTFEVKALQPLTGR
jgi:hypothetical protein